MLLIFLIILISKEHLVLKTLSVSIGKALLFVRDVQAAKGEVVPMLY